MEELSGELEPDPRCMIGFKDWTRRGPCGRVAACEVRIVHRGKPYKWQPACYQHADGLFDAISKANELWQVEMRPVPALREVLDCKAEVIPLERS